MKLRIHVAAPVLVFSLGAATLAGMEIASEPHHHSDNAAGTAPEQLGRVSFANSCSPAVQAVFERGVALLHSFWWQEGERTFREVLERDPKCAIATWGIATILIGNPFGGGPTPAQAQLAKVQALSDLRRLLGYESVPVNYDVAGPFEYEAVKLALEDLQMKALQNRPDFQSAQQAITEANSQYELQRAIGKQDVTVQTNYTHVNGINGVSFLASIPLPIFNRNQGEIARTRYAITQSQELEKAANNQVVTDVHDA